MKLPWPLQSRSAVDDAPAESALEPIRLVLKNYEAVGWIQPRGERVTDLLHSGAPLMFLPDNRDIGDWVPMEPAELLIVVPPPHVSQPERRVQRQLHEAVVRIGGYMITGTAHLMPGEELDPYLRSTRQFLPLTEATLTSEDGLRSEHVGVAIVNLKQVSEFRVL